MNKPNFYLSDCINVGLDLQYFAQQGLNTSHLNGDFDVIDSDLFDKVKLVDDFMKNLPTLFFHEVFLNYGEESGFQIYMQSLYSEDRFDFETNILEYWSQHGVIKDAKGWDCHLSECHYLRKNQKKLNRIAICRAINKEFAILHNSILRFARQLGMGEVIQDNDTIKVKYPIKIKLM